MDTLCRAVQICQEAEQAIRELMQGTIREGEYRDLPTLARIGEQMTQIAAKLAQNRELTPPPAGDVREAKGRRRPTARRSAGSQVRARSIRRDYPKFRRDGDNLIKIGWSKSRKSEYEHRAPRRVAAAVLQAASTMNAKAPVFTVNDLLRLADSTDHAEIPGYQVYLAMAWLRKEGIVRQHGREGYSLLVKGDLDKLLEDRWNVLSSDAGRRARKAQTTYGR